MPRIRRALLSVSDKTGIVDLAAHLVSSKVMILSTGGTARLLTQNKIAVTEVASYTGQPEILDGRVKTLHPKIFGGLLAVRDDPRHAEQMRQDGIEPIDLVAVNLYPFEQTVARGAAFQEIIENIDIGGPSMIRAAAKNWRGVTVLVDPADYGALIAELEKGGGVISEETNFRLARKAFAATARYDAAIANHLTRLTGPAATPSRFPDVFSFQVEKAQDLRYGENPHQAAAFYRETGVSEPCLATARQLQGKELSYNNILDCDAAIEAVKEFDAPACVIIKHTNPCGVATGSGPLSEIFANARDCDPQSAFGGIIAFNRPVDGAAAEVVAKDFYECLVAPGFDGEARDRLAKKKNLRVIEMPAFGAESSSGWTFQKVVGGLLLQDRNLKRTPVSEAKVVTRRGPSEAEWQALEFAWKVAKHVKSNAIVYARADRTVGIGAGQMSRIDAARLAVTKARVSLKGSVMASDAFFPFRDSVEEAAANGVTAIVQPGGSVRDAESIEAADENGMAMVFTGIRHFRH